MTALKILEVKEFMKNLLLLDTFDEFWLSEMEILTASRFQLDGRRNQGWYDTREQETLKGQTYRSWGSLKPFAFQVIKGNKTPQFMRGVFLLAKDRETELFQENDIDGLFLNLKYERDELTLITGTSRKTFTMDKSLDQEWDQYICSFLKEKGIAYEKI